MSRYDDRATMIEIVVEQGIVKLFPIKDIQAKRRLVQHEQFRVDGHHQREMQLRYHAFGQFSYLARALDRSLCQKTFGFGAIESRMHARDVIEQLRHANPTRQDSDISDERDFLHELIALGPWIASQYF